MKKIYFLGFLLSTFYFLLSLPSYVEATKLYLEPTGGNYYQDGAFLVNVRIDTGGECINTVSADLSFPQDDLEILDFSRENSILKIWLKNPEINRDKGLISFIGGIPGGYCGALSGDSENTNLLGKIVFRIKTPELKTAGIKFLGSSQVLLNDGFGTRAEETERGEVPPEIFQIKITREPLIL